MRLQSPFFSSRESWAMIFGICIDYRSAESIGIRIVVVLYLKRTFIEDLAACVNLLSIRGICVFNNLMTFHNNVRHSITSSDHEYLTNK